MQYAQYFDAALPNLVNKNVIWVYDDFTCTLDTLTLFVKVRMLGGVL